MNKKIIIILAIAGICLFLLTGPAFAKENVKIKISSDKWLNGKGVIIIKLVDKNGREITSSGYINYTVTDSNGNYVWKYKHYNNGIRIKYEPGTYLVSVKFYGDSRYNSASNSKYVTVKATGYGFNGENYYEDNNWGLNQRADDYIDYNYWDEEIYDDPSNYDGEGY